MAPKRESLTQIARLVGGDTFDSLFGPPQTAEPEAAALAEFVAAHIGNIASGLAAEAAASDDVTGAESASAYLNDRLNMLGDVISPEQAESIRSAFAGDTKDW